MLSNSSKWELGFVHCIVKFTISRFVTSRFECSIPQKNHLIEKIHASSIQNRTMRGYALCEDPLLR